ncbi:MAG: hypothetical protein FWD40_08090 [Treponema sp.]|nr:hypothetical protein [Treponema sp.]
MKTINFLVKTAAIIFIALMLPVSCQMSDLYDRGTVAITLPGGSSAARSITGSNLNDILNTLKYDIVATGPGATETRFDVAANSTVTLALAPGLWTVTVTAKTADGKVIGEGTGSATVEIGKHVNLSITVPINPDPGGGEDGDGNIGATLTLTGQVYADGLYTEQFTPGNQIPVNSELGGTGSISASGQLSFTIGTPDDTEPLASMFNYDEIYTFTLSDSNVNAAILNELIFYSFLNNEEKIKITRHRSSVIDSVRIFEHVIYFYVDKDVTITAPAVNDVFTDEDGYPFYLMANAINLELKAGWNAVHEISGENFSDEDGNPVTGGPPPVVIRSVTVADPANVNWAIGYFEGDNGGDGTEPKEIRFEAEFPDRIPFNTLIPLRGTLFEGDMPIPDSGSKVEWRIENDTDLAQIDYINGEYYLYVTGWVDYLTLFARYQDQEWDFPLHVTTYDKENNKLHLIAYKFQDENGNPAEAWQSMDSLRVNDYDLTLKQNTVYEVRLQGTLDKPVDNLSARFCYWNDEENVWYRLIDFAFVYYTKHGVTEDTFDITLQILTNDDPYLLRPFQPLAQIEVYSNTRDYDWNHGEDYVNGPIGDNDVGRIMATIENLNVTITEKTDFNYWPPFGTIALYEDKWFDASILTPYEVKWYGFEVRNGENYYVWWNDFYKGDGSKLLDIIVNIYDDDREEIRTSQWDEEYGGIDSAWDEPIVITADYDGFVYIRATPWEESYTGIGTYGIAYNTTGERPVVKGGGSDIQPQTIFDMHELSVEEAQEYFKGLNNRGQIIVGSDPAGRHVIYVTNWGDQGEGAGGGGYHDSIYYPWAPLTVFRPEWGGQAGDILMITGHLEIEGVTYPITNVGVMGLYQAAPAGLPTSMVSTVYRIDNQSTLMATYFDVYHTLTEVEANNEIQIRWNFYANGELGQNSSIWTPAQGQDFSNKFTLVITDVKILRHNGTPPSGGITLTQSSPSAMVNVTEGPSGRVAVTVTAPSTRSVTLQGTQGISDADDPALYDEAGTRIAFKNFNEYNFTYNIPAGQTQTVYAGTGGNVARSYVITAIFN